VDQFQEVHQSGGFCSSNDTRAHFGLGTSEIADELEIGWPSGLVQKFKNIRSRQIIWIREGENRFQEKPSAAHGK
jgi:hypothetical protein